MNGEFDDLLAAPPTAPGWYGKMPALGDFASRRLPEAFVRAWDRWLCAGLDASRAALGEAWLDCFLRAPIWRFGLMPGAIDGASWFGVMMPSVDRVGRYFPLTIAAPVALPDSLEGASRLQQWLRALHAAALAALDDGHSVASLETTLVSLGAPAGHERVSKESGSDAQDAWPILGDDLVGALCAASLARLWRETAGQSLWWCAEGPTVKPYRGLPPPAEFYRLLAAPAGG